MAAVEKRAFEHKHTVMMGRSHGIHAEPITFGHKLAIWYDELRRGRARLRARARDHRRGEDLRRGGHVRAPAARGGGARVPASWACTPAPASSQIIQRDRHAEYFTALALLGASIEKFAVEIRHLQRTEVREVEEPFTAGPEGLSAMPHKRNPILSENLTGLARLLRGYAVTRAGGRGAVARARHLALVAWSG